MRVMTLQAPMGFDHITEEEREIPSPGAGEILVRVHASSPSKCAVPVTPFLGSSKTTLNLNALLPTAPGITRKLWPGQHSNSISRPRFTCRDIPLK